MKAILILVMAVFTCGLFAQEGVDNFRGIQWDTPFDEVSEGMTKSSSKTPGFKGYEKAGDDMNFEGIEAHTVIYLFKKNKFVGASMGITKDQVDDAVALFTEKFGEPKITDTPFLKNYEWVLDKSVAVISYFPTNKSEKSATMAIRKPR